MISFQQNFFSPTVTVSHEHWHAILTSEENKKKIAQIRALRAEGNQKEADKLKRSLPAVCYQATFRESLSKAGNKGAWRKQGEAVLNGLYMLDVDHVGGAKQRLNDMMTHVGVPTVREMAEKLGIVLIHLTSSGEGLRFVAKADAERGNIADNQRWLASQLDVVADEACKDASRLSFVPSWDDIIYQNHQELLDYNNETFEERYGEQYRQGRSAGTKRAEEKCEKPVAAVAGSVVGDEACGEEPNEETPVLQQKYGGVAYGDIIKKWLDTYMPGWNSDDAATRSSVLDGKRHRQLLKLACDLRYICDKKHIHKGLVRECPLGKMLREEGADSEVDSIADSSHSYRLWRNIPKEFAKVLAAAGVREPKACACETGGTDGIDYDAWWHRLQPLLDSSPLINDACKDLPPHHKMAGVLASGAMFGTYLTRCWWEHFDGNPYRLSFLVYIIGGAASGKSKVGDINKLIMAPMKAADKAGREWERQYDEEVEKRNQSDKNRKNAAPEKQHPVVRIVPSTISNHVLYRRLNDAVDGESSDWTGEPLHLHLYTYEAELATALRAQQGSWAGKLDLECKSFQNEDAGVDYKNSEGFNGIIQVNWNQVITGTPDAMRRKIRKSTVLDGLVTRLCLFPMPMNDYSMIERQVRVIDNERNCRLRAAGLTLEKLSGCLKCDKLVDFAYEYEKELCEQAAMNDDKCLDYFRKRIPLIMIRYTLVRAVLRQLRELEHGEELQITDDDLEFARLIGDFVLEMQIHMFGNDVIEALQQEELAFKPRKRWDKTKDRFVKLPSKFTREDLMALGLAYNAARMTIKRWEKDGLIEEVDEGYVKIGSIE